MTGNAICNSHKSSDPIFNAGIDGVHDSFSKNVLRFGPIHFAKAGRYKVCFCRGSSDGGPGGGCSSPVDFALDIGDVEVTALPQSVLVNKYNYKNDASSSSHKCESQYSGEGLHCGSSEF